MRALVFTEPGVVRLRDEPEPEPAPGETILDVRASAICGSELHGFRAAGFRTPPLVMGHEFAGADPQGRRVVVNPLLSCGDCDSCRRGAPQVCRQRGLLGVHRAGGFAERVRVPDSALHELPDDVDWQSAALIEPLANAIHALGLIDSSAQRIGIVGAGPIGLLCALVGLRRGAEVLAVDLAAERRATVEALGIPVAERLDGEFDAVIDAVGAPSTRREAVGRVRPGGTAVWIGLAVDAVELPGNAVVREEKRILGSFAYAPDEFAAAVELARELDFGWTTAVPLVDAERVFYALAEGDRTIAKAVITMDSEER